MISLEQKARHLVKSIERRLPAAFAVVLTTADAVTATTGGCTFMVGVCTISLHFISPSANNEKIFSSKIARIGDSECLTWDENPCHMTCRDITEIPVS